jgi:DNA-binding MarR family transcriptional regulator
MSDIKTNNPTDNQTEKWRLEGLKGENNGFSIGNEGVPTDKQTNFQTVTFADNINKQHNYSPEQNKIDISRKDFEYARDIMNSLDEIKIQIRDKFKQLTPQEWMVFSLLYSLEEQGISNITYKILANSLKLSESSIRDYINRLLTKGIPIEKTKINNKTVLLNISNNLKNIATLSTLMQLREL